MSRAHYAPIESDHWDRCSDGFLLGESDWGDLWLPTWRFSHTAYELGGERRWTRRFTPWNPLHWPRYLNTRRRKALVMLESL